MNNVRFALILLIAIAGLLPGSNLVDAQSPDTPIQISTTAGGTRLEWHGTPLRSAAGATPGWPLVEVNGTLVPAQLVTLAVPNGPLPLPQIERLAGVPVGGTLAAAPAQIPQTLAGELRPDLATTAGAQPPQSPVVLLREGRQRGQRIVVFAITALYQSQGKLYATSDLAVTLPGAQPWQANTLPAVGPFLPGATPPTNPAANSAAVTIRVSQAGIQRITGTALAAAGLDLGTLNPAMLQLTHAGVATAIELIGTDDGRLDPIDELRFYAPAPGDRWNSTGTYWLTVGSTPGLRIALRPALPGAAPLRTTAIERGEWRNNQVFDTTLAGPDGDHWFTIDLKSGPGLPAASFSFPLTPTLPLAAGSVTLTVAGSTYTNGQHQLQAQLGASTATSTWSGLGDWSRTIVLGENQPDGTLTQLPGAAADGLMIDNIAWERPVALDFGGNGAVFASLAGTWQYQLANTAPERVLYDISQPHAPVRLTIPAGATVSFEDGTAARTYLLAGPGTLQTPDVLAHTPVDLASPLNTQVLYIAPESFTGALAPLIARRQAQGYSTRVIDVQSIYNAWSYGQVDPDAIREFLRYAAATWNPAPLAVTLVGDGTADPRNYIRRNQPNHIPPYLADVDPFLKETACDMCYAQLDGDDPRTDLLPDLWLGRLPAKTTSELTGIVAKIIGYEAAPAGGAWRSRAVFLADNYREADDKPDNAGDFAQFSEQSVALQPEGVTVDRIYFDPSPSRPPEPWREPDAAKAREKTMAAFNTGAAIVTYNGHSSQFQWAANAYQPDPNEPAEFLPLLGLFDPDLLTNRERLPVVLSMTCLSSAFQTPAFSGTSLDERLLINPNGGAVAVWGPTGLGVAHGHDALQRGFYNALWQTPIAERPLGALTLAGQVELFTRSPCCQDAIQTYILLGDPLTLMRASAGPQQIFLPFVTY